MKNLLCKYFGHRWQPTYQRHNHYYKLVCVRCGLHATKKG